MSWHAVVEILRLVAICWALASVAGLVVLTYEVRHAAPAGRDEQL